MKLMVKYTLSHWHRLETTHSPTNMLCNCHHFLHTKGNCTLGRGWGGGARGLCPPPNLVRDWASEGTTPVYIKWRLWHQPQKWRLWHVAPLLKLEAENIDFYHYNGFCCSNNLINKNDPQVLYIFGKGKTPTWIF